MTAVLFVDDEPALLSGLRLSLRKEPYTILTASSPAEALAILQRQSVEVVVSDEHMPGGSGSVFLRRVREEFPDMVRIALTGAGDLADTSRLVREGGLYRLLTKPVDSSHLAETIRQALRMRSVAQQSAQLQRTQKPAR